MQSLNHVMLIGGTGMLAAATRYLAARAEVATSFSRGGDAVETDAGRIVPIRADYYQVEAFGDAVSRTIECYGSPELVLAWFHEDEPALRLARQLADTGSPCAFFQVLGSASASPETSLAALREPYERLASIDYYQIVLGFEYENGRSRWLSNREIAEGAIRAIKARRPLSIVGVVEPWSDRP